VKRDSLPARQCVGCRTSYPKEQLLRFVCGAEGGIVFDERKVMRGRGFYICPSRACFHAAVGNRKLRAFLKGKDEADELYRHVVEHLTSSVATLLSGVPCLPAESGTGILPGDAVIVLSEDARGDVRLEIRTVSASGAETYVVPPAVMGGRHMAVITKNSPRYSPLVRNLRLYESLSSKGRS